MRCRTAGATYGGLTTYHLARFVHNHNPVQIVHVCKTDRILTDIQRDEEGAEDLMLFQHTFLEELVQGQDVSNTKRGVLLTLMLLKLRSRRSCSGPSRACLSFRVERAHDARRWPKDVLAKEISGRFRRDGCSRGTRMGCLWGFVLRTRSFQNRVGMGLVRSLD